MKAKILETDGAIHTTLKIELDQAFAVFPEENLYVYTEEQLMNLLTATYMNSRKAKNIVEFKEIVKQLF